MIALLTPLIFPLALGLALGTIAMMLSTHGGKMMAALRLEHHPAPRGDLAAAAYMPVRAPRSPAPARPAPARMPARTLRAA